MAIGINGNYGIPQPSALKESLTQKQKDKISAKGVVRRIWLAQKMQVDMTFSALTPAQYNAIVGYFYGTAVPVTYSNTLSGWTFVGFPTAAEAEFYRGASLLRDLTVSILQG